MMDKLQWAKGNIFSRFISICFLLPAWFAPHKSIRGFFHRLRGAHIGKNVEIGYFCLIDNIYSKLIYIEDNAIIAAGAVILAHDYSFFYTKRGNAKIAKVVIGKNAFVGVKAVIMPGVNIGEFAIVGANSVVTKDVPPYSTAAGVPARIIQKQI